MLVRLATLVVILLVIVAVAVVLRAAGQPALKGTAAAKWLIAVAFLPAVMIAITVLFAPLGFTVDPVGVIVNRMGPNVYIRHEEIATIERIEPRQAGFSIRVLGSGGFFGHFGWFYSRPLGWFRCYVTDRRELVVIRLHDGRKLVLSPHPAEVFVEYVERART
ncbi:MAG TPA: PH domain-containing protein [Sedimentisphaerales bacterium]|nr:PH domain-containing protein [Sedimentisphaerales bacterium]